MLQEDQPSVPTLLGRRRASADGGGGTSGLGGVGPMWRAGGGVLVGSREASLERPDARICPDVRALAVPINKRTFFCCSQQHVSFPNSE